MRSPTCDVERDDAVDQQQAEARRAARVEQRDQIELARRDLPHARGDERPRDQPHPQVERGGRARRRRRTGSRSGPASGGRRPRAGPDRCAPATGTDQAADRPRPASIVALPRGRYRGGLYRAGRGVPSSPPMPVRVRFRCQFCSADPSPETQRSLERGLRELVFGEYLDVPPGRWLVWHGRGPLGPTRYACAAAPRRPRRLRPRALRHDRPAPVEDAAVRDVGRRSRDTERAIAKGGLSAIPKWGLPS